MKRHAPAAERNRGPILDVLRQLLPSGSFVLEIASGSGQHAVYFAEHLPDITFQPSDLDPDGRQSIEAYRAELALPNLLPPIELDASLPEWPVQKADAVICANMIHISPFRACEGLFRGAARILPPGGILHLYGPFRFSGEYTAPSNAAFDASLRERNPAWGVRDTDDLFALGKDVGLLHEKTFALPANNHSLVFRKSR